MAASPPAAPAVRARAPEIDADGAVDRDGEESENGWLSAGRDAPLGGQAVLEGVMMRGVCNWAVAVRKPTSEQLLESHRSPEETALGEIEVSAFALDSALRRHRVLRLPILRGIVALGGSLAIGFRALELSAIAQFPPAEAGAPGAEGRGGGRSAARAPSPPPPPPGGGGPPRRGRRARPRGGRRARGERR